MRNPLVYLILVLWLLLGYLYYHCHCESCHTSESIGAVSTSSEVNNEEAAAMTKIVNATGPLMFKWLDATTIVGEGWDKMKADILSKVGTDKILEIIGLYRSDETNNSNFDNLGLARAHEVRKLFTDLPEERVRLIGRLTDVEVDKDNPFPSCDFDYKVNTESIKEIEDETLIYFPFNSTSKLKSSAVEKYLDDVAERVKKSGESITLVGHTDNVGDDESNIRLGQRRADIIKNYLISKGVSASKISATSLGESDPKADNSTEAGKAENRRTVLKITK